MTFISITMVSWASLRLGALLLLLLIGQEAENADVEVDKVEEKLEGVAGHVLIPHLGLRDHDLSVNDNVQAENCNSNE